MYYMPRVSLVHARHICWCGQRLRRGQRLKYTHRVIKCAFEEFVDINKVLQLSSSVNMAWYSIVTISVFILHSACLIA